MTIFHYIHAQTCINILETIFQGCINDYKMSSGELPVAKGRNAIYEDGSNVMQEITVQMEAVICQHYVTHMLITENQKLFDILI